MARVDVTEADLLAALADAARPKLTERPAGFYTMSELSVKGGVPIRTLREQMVKLRAVGRVETARVYIEGADGRITPVTAYKLKAAP